MQGTVVVTILSSNFQRGIPDMSHDLSEDLHAEKLLLCRLTYCPLNRCGELLKRFVLGFVLFVVVFFCLLVCFNWKYIFKFLCMLKN